MGIFDRMGKVMQSNLNALLDKAQDDRKLVSLNLDEMDEQVRAGAREVVQALGAEKQLQKRSDELGADVERWDKRAELALKSGDEALAREALKQKKRATGELAVAMKARAEQADAALKMKSGLERMREKLSELRMKQGTIAARAAQARSGGGAFENFRRMEEKIEGREAEGAAMAEVEDALGKGPKGEDLEAKFRELERPGGSSAEIEDELAALKKRIRV
jgi:phage shock protein A